MAKPNLLDIVQEVLNDTSGDFVNSINDTEEAEQVASIVRSTYRAMISNRNWPHTKRTTPLVPYTDNNLPTHMKLTEEIKELLSVYYDSFSTAQPRTRYEYIKWKEPDDFLRYTFGRNSEANNTLTVIDPTGVKLLIQNDKAPSYYTSFDDETMVFDSYDAEVDSTLQASKTLARAYVIPSFELDDSFIPDLPEEAFSALIEEAKSKASLKLNEVQDIKSEQEAGRQQRWLARKAWRVHGGIRYPNYGRKRGGRGHYRDPTFRNEN